MKVIKKTAYLVTICLISITALTAVKAGELTADTKLYQHILKLTRDYYAAWSYTREDTVYDDAGPFYDKGKDNVYWDPLPPLPGYRGWDEYRNVIDKIWKPAGMAAAGILFANDGSLRVWHHRNLIWTTANCIVHAEFFDGHSSTSPCRGVQLWKLEKDNWLVVHEHFSGTINPGNTLYQSADTADARVEPNATFLNLAQAVAAQWGAGPIETAADRLKPYYQISQLHLYMPWEPHNGYVSWSGFDAGLREYVTLTTGKVHITHRGDLAARQYGDIAWSAATVQIDFEQNDGSMNTADGRQTLIWIKQNNNWRIVLEHLSVPMSQ